jgi:hypothetical protein
MRHCFECLAVDYLERYGDRFLCEKCLMLYDERDPDEEDDSEQLDPEEEPQE